jgi:hypothetical protein
MAISIAAPVFAGFDTSAYPGDAAMSTWKASSPYGFAAYYLKSVCHQNASWMGKRSRLAAMGWKFLPVYVGQQVAGASPCTSSMLTAAQGRADALDASEKLAAEGFGAGYYIYLDVERCDVFPAQMAEYMGAWSAQVAGAGFHCGWYCHKHNAAEIRAVALAGSTNPQTARFWIVGGVTASFNLNTSRPADSGIEFADVWQRPASITRTFGGATVLIDENVSLFADPSFSS